MLHLVAMFFLHTGNSIKFVGCLWDQYQFIKVRQTRMSKFCCVLSLYFKTGSRFYYVLEEPDTPVNKIKLRPNFSTISVC